MRSRYYTKEIGVNPTERPLPNAVAYPVLAVIAAVAVFFVHQILVFDPAHPAPSGETAARQVSSR
jgi:hypothetical protein